jgi:hypothetical protein
MTNLDPNFHNRDPRYDPSVGTPARSWTLGVGFVIVALIIGFLAFGHSHSGDIAATAPPGVPTAMNPAPTPPATATLPAAANPAETTGSAPRNQ